jgi:tetratricopeptide (TPR) repeat protein
LPPVAACRAPLLILLLVLLAAVVAPRPAAAFVYGGVFASPAERAAVQAAERAFDLREYDEAWRLVLEARERFPHSLEAVRLHAIAGQLMARMDAIFETAVLDRTPPERHYVVHYARGWGAVLIGDIRMARRELERARELGPQPTPFEIERALLTALRMDPDANPRRLRDEYAAFVKRHADVPLAWVSYINYFNFDDPGERTRRRVVAEAMARPQRQAETHLAAINLEAERFWSDPARLLEMTRAGLAEFPDSAELGLREIRYLRQLGRREEALAVVRQWRERAPNHGDFRNDEFEILSDLQRWDEALAVGDRMPELTWQDRYLVELPLRRARILHLANRPEEAIAVLTRFLSEQPSSPFRGEAGAMVSVLQARAPGARVHLLPGIGQITQRGNYCGPATLAAVLDFWGRPATQEAIASRVYTGIAGTPPQVIREYLRTIGMESVEFSGDEASWKRLLDAGFPVLWLQFMPQGGHYRIVTGYDDIFREWILHDPNQSQRETLSYERIDDTWILPSLRRSIVIFPPGRAGDPALQGLEAPPLLVASNWLLYVFTGSNLFVGLFPALLVNVAAATVLAMLLALLLRRISFPVVIRRRWVVLGVLAIVVPANLLIGGWRLSGVVSLLLGFHLALLTLLPILAVVYTGGRLLQDYLHPRESIGLTLIITAVWLSLAFVDHDPWQWIIPVAFFVVGLPVLLAPRLWIQRAELRAHHGDAPGALAVIAPLGLHGRRYYTALCLELENLLTTGRVAEFMECARQLAAANPRGRTQRDAFQLCILLGRSLQDGTDQAALAADLRAYIATPGLARPLARLAEGLLLHAEAENGAAGWTSDRIDNLLRELATLATGRLPGLSRSRSLRGRAILDTVLLLAMIGATHHARHGGHHDRLGELWTQWSSRYALLVRLLARLGAASSTGDAAPLPGTENLALLGRAAGA